jgi:hypothetical protein
LWVNRVILVVGRLLTVFPWKRTSSGSVAMSQIPIADIRQTTAMGIAPSFAGQTKEEAPPSCQLTACQGFPTSKANKTLPGRPPH